MLNLEQTIAIYLSTYKAKVVRTIQLGRCDAIEEEEGKQ